MVSFPYYSHIFRDSYGSGMGIVWEAYHKGVPLLGVPENPIDKFCVVFNGVEITDWIFLEFLWFRGESDSQDTYFIIGI